MMVVNKKIVTEKGLFLGRAMKCYEKARVSKCVERGDGRAEVRNGKKKDVKNNGRMAIEVLSIHLPIILSRIGKFVGGKRQKENIVLRKK